MNEEDILRDRLRKIEALFAGASTPGEKAAAGAAAERLREKLKTEELKEKPVEMKYSIADPWARSLFLALARRYGLRPYRYPRMHRQTVMLKGPPTFLDTVLWPQFQQLSRELARFLDDVTKRVISEEVFGDTRDADEVPEAEKRLL
jgi:hypothetical protein